MGLDGIERVVNKYGLSTFFLHLTQQANNITGSRSLPLPLKFLASYNASKTWNSRKHLDAKDVAMINFSISIHCLSFSLDAPVCYSFVVMFLMFLLSCFSIATLPGAYLMAH